jgi:hypothetical protein
MASTSASAQIALAVKATLDGYELPQISKEPTILTVKNFTVELCQMAAAVESNKSGGQFGHMHLILKEKEYRIATNDNNATVNLLKKPPSIHPGFQTLKKENSPNTRSSNWRLKQSNKLMPTSPRKRQQKKL